MANNFWKNKKVFITGHTGFKGSWLCLILKVFGADITGYALNPPTDLNLYDLCNIHDSLTSIIADIRDQDKLKKEMKKARPEIVIHMAAQPIVRESYLKPSETYEINVMGTVNLFEAIKDCNNIKAVINVTTDKCYENKGLGARGLGFKESDSLGGYDPYSSSKACSEIVTAAYRSSFFNPNEYKKHGVAIATARAGNVIGGGDWAQDRLIPDFVRSVLLGKSITIRNPKAIRPWQHVLDPLNGYLLLAQRLYENGPKYGEAWNFGPENKNIKTVEWILKELCEKWGKGAKYHIDQSKQPHEAGYLKLNTNKSRSKLNWKPKWNLGTSLDKIVSFTKDYIDGKDVKATCLKQIEEYYAK